MDAKVRVLVVDDSAFASGVISKILASSQHMDVVGIARDGIEALEKVKDLKPDVVTLDVAMPRMDGIATLGCIMSECPTPVVMLSALTGENTHATIEALEMGAVDFFLKPSALNPAGRDDTALDLLSKVQMAAKVPVSVLRSRARVGRARRSRQPVKTRSRVPRKVVVIGSSTGGPRALTHVIPELPADIPAAILLVQHMPPGFTRSLAERLDSESEISIKEAEEGDGLNNGQALLAPGGYHMVVNKRNKIALNQDPPVCGVRPSVDVTMESVASVYGASSLGIVLTGMGSDGTNGADSIKKAGGKVAVEHESTCAIYGMPRNVIEAGCADIVVPLHRMADELARLCRE